MDLLGVSWAGRSTTCLKTHSSLGNRKAPFKTTTQSTQRKQMKVCFSLHLSQNLIVAKGSYRNQNSFQWSWGDRVRDTKGRGVKGRT